jgi:hypothetical protein
MIKSIFFIVAIVSFTLVLVDREQTTLYIIIGGLNLILGKLQIIEEQITERAYEESKQSSASTHS